MELHSFPIFTYRPCFHRRWSEIWDSGKVWTEVWKSFKNGKIKSEWWPRTEEDGFLRMWPWQPAMVLRCNVLKSAARLLVGPSMSRWNFFSILKYTVLLWKDSRCTPLKTPQFGPVPCQLIVPLLKADGLTCSLVPEDSSLGYKDLTNLASADFNYFYKMDY